MTNNDILIMMRQLSSAGPDRATTARNISPGYGLTAVSELSPETSTELRYARQGFKF